MDDIYGDFWETFLEETGTPSTTVLTDVTYFGTSEEESVTVLEQLLSGEKTAVGHCVPAYLALGQRLPKVGDYTMVTDFYGNPCCILKTQDVTIAPMEEIGPELRRQERPELTAEGWLQSWQSQCQDLAKARKFHYDPGLALLVESVQRVYPVKGDGQHD